jgi:hypothetical protein
VLFRWVDDLANIYALLNLTLLTQLYEVAFNPLDYKLRAGVWWWLNRVQIHLRVSLTVADRCCSHLIPRAS